MQTQPTAGHKNLFARCWARLDSRIEGLERDEVLSRIGNTTPGSFTLGGNVSQLIKWGLLPLLLAVASYYPDLGHSLLQFARTFGVSFG